MSTKATISDQRIGIDRPRTLAHIPVVEQFKERSVYHAHGLDELDCGMGLLSMG